MGHIPSALYPEDRFRVEAIIREIQGGRRRFVHAEVGRGLRHALQSKWGDPAESGWAMRACLALVEESGAKHSALLAKRVKQQYSGGCVDAAVAAQSMAAGYSVRSRNAEGQVVHQYTMFGRMTLKEALKARSMMRRQRDRADRVLTQMDVGIRCYRLFPDAANVAEACALAGISIEVVEEAS